MYIQVYVHVKERYHTENINRLKDNVGEETPLQQWTAERKSWDPGLNQELPDTQSPNWATLLYIGNLHSQEYKV